MQIRQYNKITDESKLMKMIDDEEGWDYANETLAEKRKLMECICKDYPNHVVYVMSDVDGYYEKVDYKRIGSIFKVPCR